jgi:hypothetical protein
MNEEIPNIVIEQKPKKKSGRHCRNCESRIIEYPLYKGQEEGLPFEWKNINWYNAIIGDTTTVIFYRFVATDPTPVISGGGNMAIGIGGPPVSIDPDSVPLPSQTSYTAAANTSLTISGSGFTGVNRVRFASGGGSVTITGATDSGFTFTVPSLAMTGPLVIYKVLSTGSVSPIFVDFIRS